MTWMRVDGNVLAGMLDDLLASDATMLVGICGSCGSRAPLAEAVVEIDSDCAIVLCRGCTHTLFTVLRSGDGVTVRFGALGSLERSTPAEIPPSQS